MSNSNSLYNKITAESGITKCAAAIPLQIIGRVGARLIPRIASRGASNAVRTAARGAARGVGRTARNITSPKNWWSDLIGWDDLNPFKSTAKAWGRPGATNWTKFLGGLGEDATRIATGGLSDAVNDITDAAKSYWRR